MLDKESYLFSTFFGLREAEVQQKTIVNNWHHIPSASNVAELLTKGCSPAEIGSGSVWQQGPAFLTEHSADQWPVTPRPIIESKETRDCLLPFIRKTKVLTLSCNTAVDSLDILVVKCSNLEKLLRIIAYVRRFHLTGRSQRTGGRYSNYSQ